MENNKYEIKKNSGVTTMVAARTKTIKLFVSKSLLVSTLFNLSYTLLSMCVCICVLFPLTSVVPAALHSISGIILDNVL